MFLPIFQNVLCVMLLILPGLASKRAGWMSDRTVAELSGVQVRLIYPCLIFTTIFSNYGIGRIVDCAALPAGAFALMAAGHIIGRAAAGALRFGSDAERRAFLLQSTINNYSFLPLPLVDMLYGSRGVAALLLSSLGAEVAVWTLGVMSLTGSRMRLANLRHLLSPPLMALYAAVAARMLCDTMGWTDAILDPKGAGLGPRLLATLRMMGAATIPVAMVVAGCRLAGMTLGGLNNLNVWALAAMRLVAIPAAGVCIMRLLPLNDMERGVMTIVCAMPVAIASFVMSEVYGGDKEFVNTTVAVTHALALATVPAMLALTLPPLP